MICFVDLDGTLIDSFKRHYLLLQDLFDEYSIDKVFNIDDYILGKRNGINNYDYMINNLHIESDLAKTIANEWKQRIENYDYIKNDVLYGDAIEFLTNLMKVDCTIIYLTSRNNINNTIEEINNLCLNKYCDDIIVVNGYETTKDSCIKRYKDDNMIIIGDSEVDYNAAISCNIGYYILNRGFRSSDFLAKKGISKTYNNLFEVWEDINGK